MNRLINLFKCYLIFKIKKINNFLIFDEMNLKQTQKKKNNV